MAKQGKALPARRLPERSGESTFLRSAEALGRIIGTLQRQLDGATKRLGASNHTHVLPVGTRGNRNGHVPSIRTGRRKAEAPPAGSEATSRTAAATTKPGTRKKKRNQPPAAKAGTRSAGAKGAGRSRSKPATSRAKKVKSTATGESRRRS